MIPNMKPIKQVILIILIILPWRLVFANDYPSKVIAIMHHCYSKIEAHDPDMTAFPRCVQTTLNTIPNPQDYQVYVRSEKPGKGNGATVKILMVNKSGHMVYCIAATEIKFVVKSCANLKRHPLSPNEELTIDDILKEND
ncbi:hypothetical protein [uncultured Legionella sp.]|uniref:hypothetical protein n=1 Tax=uncultured Legionella sp. TaxID=210934 RepID=UPI002636665D|nr:hypothetical protein [uncultured Legionella sp.]